MARDADGDAARDAEGDTERGAARDADGDAARAAALVAAAAAELGPRVGVTAPAQAWGVFAGDELVHASGASTAAFRIASCTKSFTAAAALLLEADGLLDLDEPLADALDVPLRILGTEPSDPAPTIRDALAMRAGLPTDDPWADRQESLSHEAFGRVLSDGVRALWPARAHFEYSNLGYAIVGRIIGLRAGMPYLRFVEQRLLAPLGLDGTGFEATPAAITGHRRGPDGWEPLPFSGPGAFSPIGGLFSTVADLARWCGVLSGAIDASDVLPDGLVERMRHPETPVLGDPAGAGPWLAYGLGVMVRGDGAGRRFVGHSGGYPGFGARMDWETASRIGAVALENAGYPGLTPPVRAALDAVFPTADAEPAEPPAPAFVVWPETVAAAELVRAALAAGRMPDAALLDPCVDQDVPLARRATALAGAIAEIGGVDTIGPLVHDTPAHAGWTLDGPRGSIDCAIILTPTAVPRVQRLDIVSGAARA